GLLTHFDLANYNSVMAVQTEDMGVMDAGGFSLRGRATDAELRGCSLTVEELWARQ
ncbi:MAG: putative acyl protein synthase/acyl-CoA reductase-like protein, partial [Capsulimonas sp.]|nr:putative acyl protein synthase/acyl-CoA reductase-like protein [Capsulimonas sp.]